MIAILDSTVFNICAHIESCDIISLATAYLFRDVLVPMEVKNELSLFPFQHDKQAGRRIQVYVNVIERSYKSGLKLCQTFEAIVFAQLQAVVDKGEAEGIAQAEKIATKFFFTDDDICKNVLKDNYQHVGFYSTLHLISLLDIGGWLPDYHGILKEYFAYKPLPTNTTKRRAALKNFRSDYTKAAEHFGVAITKKELARKTSPRYFLQ